MIAYNSKYTTNDDKTYEEGCYDGSITAADSNNCINNCMSECNYLAIFSGSEPNYIATKPNIEIPKDTEIIIKATGSIKLESNTDYGPFTIKPELKSLHLRDDNNDIDVSIKLLEGSF